MCRRYSKIWARGMLVGQSWPSMAVLARAMLVFDLCAHALIRGNLPRACAGGAADIRGPTARIALPITILPVLEQYPRRGDRARR